MKYNAEMKFFSVWHGKPISKRMPWDGLHAWRDEPEPTDEEKERALAAYFRKRAVDKRFEFVKRQIAEIEEIGWEAAKKKRDKEVLKAYCEGKPFPDGYQIETTCGTITLRRRDFRPLGCFFG